jgi:DNA-binding transcriptional MerR regulator
MQLDLLDKASALADVRQVPSLESAVKDDAGMVAVAERFAHEDDSKEKAPNAFRTISEVANFLNVPQYVLRFWESRFSQIKPVKMRGGRRYYRPEDVEVLSTIKNLLYKQGYTINGAKKAFSKGAAIVSIEEMVAQEKTPVLSDKENNQLAVLRQELISMRDILKPHVF